MPNGSIHQIATKNLKWINITKNNVEEIEYLRENFNFHPLDLEDCLSPAQRPKIEKYDDYIFVILTFPVYDRKTRAIYSEEIDFFVGKDFLVTIHNNEIPPINDFFTLCNTNDVAREKSLGGNPGVLMYEILDRLMLYCYPILDHINIDTVNIEKRIFSGEEKTLVEEILIVKRNIVTFRKTMQTHKEVIKKMVSKECEFFSMEYIKNYYNNLIDHVLNIWDVLENHKETINALQETNESLISFKLNNSMRTLSVIAVITFPISMIATIFSMRIENGMPLIGNPLGFWIVITLMLIVALTMIMTFKAKKWL
jgi:magnesium transporter